jgi:ankyrin repeat protein
LAFLFPLQVAARVGSPDVPRVVKLLLRNGADPNHLERLHPAAVLTILLYKKDLGLRGVSSVLELLTDKGADVNMDKKSTMSTALQFACEYYDAETVALLIRKGAAINAPAGSYSSALQIALKKGNEKIIELLKAAGAVESDAGAAEESDFGLRDRTREKLRGPGRLELLSFYR